MKYLLILLAVLAGVWLWRKQRVQQEQPPQRRAPPQLQDMVRCQVCDLHLPARAWQPRARIATQSQRDVLLHAVRRRRLPARPQPLQLAGKGREWLKLLQLAAPLLAGVAARAVDDDPRAPTDAGADADS